MAKRRTSDEMCSEQWLTCASCKSEIADYNLADMATCKHLLPTQINDYVNVVGRNAEPLDEMLFWSDC